MNDEELRQRLAERAQNTMDPAAKQRAIAAAMAEFNHHQQAAEKPSQKNWKIRQGFFQWLRLTSQSQLENRRKDMTLAHQKWLMGSIATGCVAVFAVMVSLYNPLLKAPEVPLNSTDETAQAPVPEPDQTEEIVVTGIRSSLETAQQLKREPSSFADGATTTSPAIDREIDAMPEAPVAESLQRLEGVQIRTAEPALAKSIQKPAARNFAPPARTDMPPPVATETGRDRFESVETNPIKLTSAAPVSTFSIDVDTASYSFVRRQLNNGVLPQKDAVRLEEMVNYFDYNYPLPEDKSQPFKPTITVLPSPWNSAKKLVHIGIKGYPLENRPNANLVFLLDVSGSMGSPDKLPLVKQSMSLLLSKMQPDDTVSIAVYAGAAGTVLEPTKVADKQKILDALNRLNAGGSTAGAQGLQLAYQLAESGYRADAVNRIILATDGDFNVGITNQEELKGFVERKREKGIALSILGFGAGNYQDALMQQLAQNGNGIAAYIDTLSEAQKVLVDQASGTLFTIAKDVKIQVEFNPATVAEYRLLGYETRQLKREDFNNDAVDAGEIGAGHTVTAIYEITPVQSSARLIDDSRYTAAAPSEGNANEYGFLKIRYKMPDKSTSTLISEAIPVGPQQASASQLQDARFATAVAGFAQLLKDKRYTGSWSFDDALTLAQANKGDDEYGYRTEFVQLIRKAKIANAM